MNISRYAKNNQGIALITALCITLISLTIIMAIMYMITNSIKKTGGMNAYKTALEASYGGTGLLIHEVVPSIFKYALEDPNTIDSSLATKFSGLNMAVGTTNACLLEKLDKLTSEWSTSCSQTFDLKNANDLNFNLQATGGQPYTIYTKIVDTISIGNTDNTGLDLDGGGVAAVASSEGGGRPIPYVYRLEILAERSNNPLERAVITVLYAK